MQRLTERTFYGVHTLSFNGSALYLAENAESESVRLGATRDLLDRAGFRPIDRHEIVKEKSVEELNAQLVSSCRREWGRDANKCFQKQEKHLRP